MNCRGTRSTNRRSRSRARPLMVRPRRTRTLLLRRNGRSARRTAPRLDARRRQRQLASGSGKQHRTHRPNHRRSAGRSRGKTIVRRGSPSYCEPKVGVSLRETRPNREATGLHLCATVCRAFARKPQELRALLGFAPTVFPSVGVTSLVGSR